MGNCRFGRFFIRLIPLRRWRDAFFERHIRRCPLCLEGLAEIKEARSATWSREDFEGKADLWPRLREELLSAEPAKTGSFPFRRRWLIPSAAAAGFAIAAGILILKWDQRNRRASSSDIKMAIESSLIYNEPAQAFYFQTQDENTTFVWMEKTNKGEKP